MVLDARGSSVEAHAARRLTAEHVAARALVESATFGDAAPKILQAICEALDWEYGALWRIDAEAEALLCVDTWRRSADAFPEFDRASRDITFGHAQRQVIADDQAHYFLARVGDAGGTWRFPG